MSAFKLFLSCFLCFFFITVHGAEKMNKPLWELGVFGGAAYIPDYPASEQSRLRWIAAPFALYRGKVMRVDEEEGARARLYQKPFFDLIFSLSGSFPADSDKNQARMGMPDLNWLLELGPNLVLNLWQRRNYGRLQFNLPLRAVLETDITFLRQQGLIFAPSLFYQKNNFLLKDSSLFLSLTSRWGSQKIQDYFYQIDSHYQNSTRSAYNARSGYFGTSLFAGLSLRFKTKYEIFNALLFDFHQGAKNRRSDLFKQKKNLSYILGFSWRFLKSEKEGYQ